MAERPGELKGSEQLDPVSTNAGAGKDNYVEKYSGSDLAGDSLERQANATDTPEETDQIKARIEETRSQMGETIDAIQERLSFANISEQVSETVSNAIETAKDTAYDATVGKAVNFMKNVGDGVTHSSAFNTVKNNPLPLALIGIGAGLLVYQGMGSKNSYRRAGNGGYGKSLYGGGERRADRSGFDSGRGSISDTASKTYEGISDTASSAIGTVSGAAGTAYENVSGAVGTVYTGAEDLAHRAYDRAGELGTKATEKYDEYLEENPLALGALAVALGAAVGFAIPSTRYEGELMGDARENLLQRAQDAAGTLVDKAKQVATEAGETIKHETQSLTK